MRIVVCYDVATQDADGRRRLRKIAEACKNHGVRVQYSIFECQLSEVAWVNLRHRLLKLMNPEKDSIRIYYLNEAALKQTEHYGQRTPLDLDAPLIF